MSEGEINLAEHLPALQVVVPLFGALIASLVRHGPTSWLVALVSCWAMPVIAFSLLGQVLAGGPISYALGGWEPPIGIEYRVDAASGFLLVLVSVMAALVMTYAPRSIADEIPPERQGWYYSAFLLCLAGLLGIAITGDAFNLFVFLEVSSLATYILIALGRDRRALVSAYQYLVIGTTGATFYVIGVGLLLAMTGTLNLVDIASELGGVENQRPLIAALAFIGVGIALKLALFPLHLWLPPTRRRRRPPSSPRRRPRWRSTCCSASSSRSSASTSPSATRPPRRWCWPSPSSPCSRPRWWRSSRPT